MATTTKTHLVKSFTVDAVKGTETYVMFCGITQSSTGVELNTDLAVPSDADMCATCIKAANAVKS